MEDTVRIFTAEKIITMYPEQPLATAVAVKEGKILATGEVEELEYWIRRSAFPDYTIDDQFREMVLMPGLVDAHTHVELQGFIYSGEFLAQIPWPDPKGGFFPVYPGKEDVLDRLKDLDKALPPDQPIYGVAYDENKAGTLSLEDLDPISPTRPILISNLVFHRFWANSALLEKAGITPGNLPAGVMADGEGHPDGTLIESDGLMAVLPALPELFGDLETKISRILPLFTRAGNTTVCDAALGAFGLDFSLDLMGRVFKQQANSLRMVGLPWTPKAMSDGMDVQAFIEAVQKAGALETDNFRIGAAKLYTDGSLISKTAPAEWPGYWDGTPQGHMACDPETVTEWIIELHKTGIPTVTHTNTSLGCQLVLDAVEQAQALCFRPDIRHRMDHCYTITEAQLCRAKALGVCVQFFTPQLHYYGESHLRLLGPGRAPHLTPVGTARRLGVSWGFHNDPPGTPQLPWTGAHAVISRLTRDSQTLMGGAHCVPVDEVLRAMTIDAAFQMHLDHEIGSIVPGKRADFCVLEKDPLTMDPKQIKYMPVWGTVFGGTPQKSVGN